MDKSKVLDDGKDYAFKNEISLSIGDESMSSTPSTPSTATPPPMPTPTPRQAFMDDTKPLTKNTDDMKIPAGIDNHAFDNNETTPSAKPLSSFGNGHSNGLNDTPALGANGATKNGQLNEKKLAGKKCLSNKRLLFLIKNNLYCFISNKFLQN